MSAEKILAVVLLTAWLPLSLLGVVYSRHVSLEGGGLRACVRVGRELLERHPALVLDTKLAFEASAVILAIVVLVR